VLAADQKTEIKGGIEGYVKSVDLEGKKLTIMVPQGRDRTFTITDETMMFGPNGGKVRKHLKDPRFREGFHVTVVPEGNNAEEVHLGFAREALGAKTEHTALKPSIRGSNENETTDRSRISPTLPMNTRATSRNADRYQEATKAEEQDDDEEIPGHVKSFDADRRILVVSLFNGKTRSFILARDVPIYIKGATAASRYGLGDPELKADAFVTVVTDEAGRKVKELKITPASQLRRKRAG
jgi:hypothetical protein